MNWLGKFFIVARKYINSVFGKQSYKVNRRFVNV